MDTDEIIEVYKREAEKATDERQKRDLWMKAAIAVDRRVMESTLRLQNQTTMKQLEEAKCIPL
jgi:hypothetical protein